MADRLYAEQVKLLHDQGLAAVVVAPLAATIIVALIWSAVPHGWAVAWLAGALIVSLFRLYQLVRYRALKPDAAEARSWGRRYILGGALAGGYWGAGGVVLFPPDSLPYQLVLMLAMCVVLVTFAFSFAAVKAAFFAVTIPMMSPLALIVAWQGGRDHLLLAVNIGVFTVLVSVYMSRVNRLIRRSLELRFENTHLIDYLAASKEETEALNARLARSGALLTSTLEASADGIAGFDSHGRLITWNRKFLKMWGLPEQLVVHAKPLSILRRAARRTARPKEWLHEVIRASRSSVGSVRVLIELANGSAYEAHSEPQLIGGRISGRVWSFRDVTERRQAEARLARLAHYDSLTGLPNRALFYDRLRQAVVRAERQGGDFVLLYLDLDGFKAVNDGCGHGIGDRLLQSVADRLLGCLRATDTVARIGGDEFVVILEQVSERVRIEAAAGKIVESLAAAYPFAGKYRVGVSVGIALYPADGREPEELLRRADAAMYAAKTSALNGFRFFGDLSAPPLPDPE